MDDTLARLEAEVQRLRRHNANLSEQIELRDEIISELEGKKAEQSNYWASTSGVTFYSSGMVSGSVSASQNWPRASVVSAHTSAVAAHSSYSPHSSMTWHDLGVNSPAMDQSSGLLTHDVLTAIAAKRGGKGMGFKSMSLNAGLSREQIKTMFAIDLASEQMPSRTPLEIKKIRDSQKAERLQKVMKQGYVRSNTRKI